MKEVKLKKEKEPLILITNDDGISAKGLKSLINVLKSFGKLMVVAPEYQCSGTSHAITVKVPLRVNKVSENRNIIIYSCSGTPVDCVKLALNQLLERKPDLLISGINHGSNASISVVYSGTMAAAIEGCINKVPSVGLSLIDHSKDADFTLACKYSKKIAENILKNSLPAETCLNVNFPVVSLDEVKGVKICRQTKGFWKEEFEKKTDPNKRPYYWLTGNFVNFESEAKETDEWALRNKYVSIVPVQVDFTSYKAIEDLKKWNFELC